MKLIDCSVQQARFLAAFAVCGQVQQAARWCKIHRQAHYGWMYNDPTYPARFKEAEQRAARSLRDEAVRRAHDGLRKAVWYKGKVVGYETEYSDTLLLGLLKALDPEFREKVEHVGANGGPIDLRAALMAVVEKLPEESRALVARELLALEKTG
jgi:hypothetical protein